MVTIGGSIDSLRKVDLNLLISLNVLLDENSVTRAARRLNLSQSSVSTQLSKLRLIFDDQLLVPASNGRGMLPTSKAKEIRTSLKHLLHGLGELVSHGQEFDPQMDKRIFNVAIADYPLTIISKILMPKLFIELGDRVQIAFHTDVRQASEMMERGELDLVIASERGIPLDAKAALLLEEKFVLAQRKNHPRGTGTLSLDEYCQLKHILVSTSGGSFFGFMDEQLQKMGKSRHISISVTQFNIVNELLKGSDFVCTLPSKLVQYYSDDLNEFELPFEAKGFKLYLGWHSAYDKDPALRWLKSQFMEAYR
ncbi:MAG: LysR family transcriptional regulator [Pseudomonadota bacterium]|nr:LysR family transcriptional regulator [Pseudomonadota bacterium]